MRVRYKYKYSFKYRRSNCEIFNVKHRWTTVILCIE